jgi:hypothetical protein
MEPISGFGNRQDDAAYGVGILYAAPGWQVFALIAAALIAPGLVALALAAGLDGEARERRTRLLAAMGAGRRQRAIVDITEALPAVTFGTIAAALTLVRLCIGDVAVPTLDARLSAADTRSAWPSLIGSLVASLLVSLAAVLLVRMRPPWRRRRNLMGLDQSRQVGRAGICLLAALATVWIPAQSQSAPVRTLSYGAGALFVAITLPALVSVLLAVIGEGAAAWGLRRGSAGSLLGGRRLQRFPRRTARLALGVCFGVLILGQIQLWASQLGEQYFSALHTRTQVGSSVLIAGNTTYGQPMQRFLGGLPTTVVPVWLAIEPPPANDPTAPATTRLISNCKGLASLGLACADDAPLPATIPAELVTVLRWAPNVGNVHIRLAEAPVLDALKRDQAQLLLISPTHQNLPLDDLQRKGYTTVPGGLQLDTLGQSWVTSGRNLIIRANWTVALGVLGVVCLVVATAAAMAGDVITSARNLAPLAVLTGRRRWLLTVTGWRTTLPLALAGALGASFYLILPSGLSAGAFSMSPSSKLALWSAAASLLMGVLMAVWSAKEISRTSSTWRPNS